MGFGVVPLSGAFELGRDHLGVVEDERVAGGEQRRQIAHDAVGVERGGVRIDHEEPRRVARLRRPKRDQLRRQVKVEQVGAQ